MLVNVSEEELSYILFCFLIFLSCIIVQVARYRGQGRLAESGFKNPRWVDGELVILDGKVGILWNTMLSLNLIFGGIKYQLMVASFCKFVQYIKGGPVVGFVYWAPEFHFLVFFNRLRLQD